MDALGAALLPKFGGYVVEDARGEVLALVGDDRDEAEHWKRVGHDWLLDAAASGHPRAAGWVAAREPLSIRVVTEEEAAAIREEGVPLLQREP